MFQRIIKYYKIKIKVNLKNDKLYRQIAIRYIKSLKKNSK